MTLVETAYIQLVFDRLADLHQTLPGSSAWEEEANHILRILYEALLGTDPNVPQIGGSYQHNDRRIQQLPPKASWFAVPVISPGMFSPASPSPLPSSSVTPPPLSGTGTTGIGLGRNGLPVGSPGANCGSGLLPSNLASPMPSLDFDPDDDVCLLPDHNGRPCRKKRYHGVDHDGNPSDGDN